MAATGRVAVVGGGFSGAAFALQAVRDTAAPMSVTVFEPAQHLGAGLAYSTADPDHRLNAPAFVHYALPDSLDRFEQCFVDTGGPETDPESEAPAGGLFPRRCELAAHMARLIRPHLAANDEAPGIRHRRDRVVDLRDRGEAIDVVLDQGDTVAAQAVVVATGNRPAPPPPPFSGAVSRHPAFVASPWDPARLRAIVPDARVLILGTAQSTADVIATLVRQGHRAPIAAVSRRGLRSKGRKPPTGAPPAPLWPRLFAPVPDFLAAQESRPTLLGLLRALRRRCREVEAAGGTWHDPFDDLRDTVWRLWPKVSVEDKRRFMRHLRPWYDTHRFRLAPQTEKIVTDAESRGLVCFRAAHVVSAAADGGRLAVGLRPRGGERVQTEAFDAVVNCTGTTAGPGDDPFSQALEAGGLMRPHGSGLGWDVDGNCRAIRKEGDTVRRLFVIGPPSAGVFGDPIGSPFIVAQIWRMLPAVRALIGEEVRADRPAG